MSKKKRKSSKSVINKFLKSQKAFWKEFFFPKSIYKRIWNWLVILVFSYFVFYQCSFNAYQRYQLRTHGKQVSAFVYDSYSQRSHTWYLYKFTINEQHYNGRLFSTAKIGDSIMVIYLPKDPNINRAQMDLK
jgi:hypothetical protein